MEGWGVRSMDLETVKANARAFAASRALIGEGQWLRDFEAFLTIEDEDTRFEAVDEIYRITTPDFAAVAEWADDARPEVRAAACYALRLQDYREDAPERGALFYPQGVPILLKKLHDPESQVRADAAFALGHIGDAQSLPALINSASDTSEDVRYGVAFALGSFHEDHWEKYGEQDKPATRAALLRLMDDEDEDVRDWATFGIHQGQHDTPEARARLWRALDDPNPDVRGEAAEGLALFDDRSFLLRLDRLLREDEDISPCYFIAAETFNDPVLLPAVLEAAENWRGTLAEGEKLHGAIVSAIEKLQETAASASAPQNE